MSPLAAQPARRVAVIGGARVPFARSDGPYATASNQEMLTAALDALVERHGLQEPGAVGEFVAGAVLKHSRDFNLARETVLGSALDPPPRSNTLARGDPHPPPTTSSRPAAPDSRP